MIGVLRKREQLPVVCFVFSKKRCESLAAFLGKTDLTDAGEKNAIISIIDQSIARLSPDDRFLPQVCQL